MSNPYASSTQPKNEGRLVGGDVNDLMARLSWRMPLAGLALLILLSCILEPFVMLPAWIGVPFVMLPGILFCGSIVVGLMFAIIALSSSIYMKRWRVTRLAICGLVLNALFMLALYLAVKVVPKS